MEKRLEAYVNIIIVIIIIIVIRKEIIIIISFFFSMHGLITAWTPASVSPSWQKLCIFPDAGSLQSVPRNVFVKLNRVILKLHCGSKYTKDIDLKMCADTYGNPIIVDILLKVIVEFIYFFRELLITFRVPMYVFFFTLFKPNVATFVTLPCYYSCKKKRKLVERVLLNSKASSISEFGSSDFVNNKHNRNRESSRKNLCNNTIETFD